ncbi:MAG: GLUG motif-containing protein [Candidatus Stygibacter australis]|nr:GLUG motif-containing protein [Candidatus Stygibacter australis]
MMKKWAVVLLFVSMLIMLGAFVDENVEKSSSEEISSINNAIGGGRPITFSGGDGSEGNPWQITDLDDLQYLSETSGYWGDFFIQTDDIDASTTSTWDDGNGGDPEGFIPIGNSSDFFTGFYNGQGHVIDGLFINRVNNNIGLFGRTSGAEIENIGIINSNITGWQYVGVLAGYTLGTSFNNCYTSGSVEGGYQTGGLIGMPFTSSSITNCYAMSSVIGTSETGGLVGHSLGSVISNCYANGSVSVTEYSGGLIGFSETSTVQNCFWNSQTSGQTSSAGGTGKTTADMQNVATFTETDTEGLTTPWDFVTNPNDDSADDDYWDMDQLGTVNNGYPYLNWDYLIDPPLPVTLSSFTAIYNGDNPVIQWITCSEMQNSGWNVYRNCEEDYSSSLKLNIDLIPGAGSSTEMHNYSYQDEYEVEHGTCYYYWLESISNSGGTENFGPLSLNIPHQEDEEEAPPVPDQFNLLPNYPNPFNPETCISYNLPFECQTELSIYNIKGKKIITLVNGIQEAGFHSHIWNGKDENGLEISSGVYIYRLETEYYKMAKTMVLVK